MLNPNFLAVDLGAAWALIIGLAGLVLAIFWMFQFVQLMLLEDAYFAGRHDKIIWAAAFLIVVPLAPFAFLMWKGAKTGERVTYVSPDELAASMRKGTESGPRLK